MIEFLRFALARFKNNPVLPIVERQRAFILSNFALSLGGSPYLALSDNILAIVVRGNGFAPNNRQGLIIKNIILNYLLITIDSLQTISENSTAHFGVRWTIT